MGLIEGAQITKAIHRQILGLIAGMPQVAVLRAGSGRRDGWRALRLAAIKRVLCARRSSRRTFPRGSPIIGPFMLCVAKRYLASKSQVELEWPLAERSNIGYVLRVGELSVRHYLLNKDPPHSIRLANTPELFKRAKAERHSLAQDLGCPEICSSTRVSCPKPACRK